MWIGNALSAVRSAPSLNMRPDLARWRARIRGPHNSREVERLKQISDDLLWLARFDSAPPPASDAIDFATIADSCADRFKAVAGARSVDLQLERIGGTPATILAPADWIERLAGVRVDNACKYASEGGTVRTEVGEPAPEPFSLSKTAGRELPRRA